MKNVSLRDDSNNSNEDDVTMEPYCKCPLGFHGQFCEKAVDVQVIDVYIYAYFYDLLYNTLKMAIFFIPINFIFC